MKATDYANILKFINRFRDECDWMSEEGVKKLEITLKSELYAHNIKDFYNYLINAMPESDDEDAWDEFYTTPFRISFGEKSVRIENEATIYEGIRTTIEELIESCL